MEAAVVGLPKVSRLAVPIRHPYDTLHVRGAVLCAVTIDTNRPGKLIDKPFVSRSMAVFARLGWMTDRHASVPAPESIIIEVRRAVGQRPVKRLMQSVKDRAR